MRFLESLKPLGLLLLRLAVGITFVSHGYPKLIGNPAHWVEVFPRLGFPGYFAYLSGTLELFAGGLLIFGLFTRGAALLLAIEMAVALAWMHIPAIDLSTVGKYEQPLVLGAAALALATTGAGLISIDAFTFESRKKPPKKARA
jgi:putative oxidoreductase